VVIGTDGYTIRLSNASAESFQCYQNLKKGRVPQFKGYRVSVGLGMRGPVVLA